MANPRIDDLRKRLEKEPGSRIFGQLAEELRKDGDLEEAIQVCREGLQRHSNYPSARMTLGRALFESGDLARARTEFELVLKGAPDNILASRMLGESLEGLGELEAALDRYKKTLTMAPGEKHVAAQLEALERTLKNKAVAPPAGQRAATPAAASEPPPEPEAAPEPAPIKLVEVNEPMELERPHEVPLVSLKPPEAPRAPAPEPQPAAQEEVVEFDEVPTLPRAAAPQPERPAQPASPSEEMRPPTLPLGTAAPRFPEPDLTPGPVPPPPPPPTVFTTSASSPEPQVQPEVSVPREQVFEPEPEVEVEQRVEPPAPPAPSAAAAVNAPSPAPMAEPSAAEVPAPRSEPAVPEELASVTLAELYFSQGFADKAVTVLKQLLEREPANERARARLSEIEAREAQLRVEQERVAAATGAADGGAARRQAIERTIAGLERMLGAIRKG